MRIAVLALDNVYLSGLATVLDVIRLHNVHSLNRLHENDPVVSPSPRRTPWISPWRAVVLSGDGRPVRSSSGQAIAVDGSIEDRCDDLHAIMVPAIAFDALDAFEARLDQFESVSAWLERQRDGGAVLMANHTGIFVLAQAGIPDGAVVTVPFALEKLFRQRFPRVKLDLTRAVVESQNILVGAALNALYDLTWRFLERNTSAAVARRLFEDLFFEGIQRHDRDPADSGPPDTIDPLVERAQSWLIHHLAQKVTMNELARSVSTSERTLFRRFKDTLGVTPHDYLKNLRLETAKRGLQRTELKIDQVAAGVGYADAAFFTQQFKAHTGVSPSAYRKQFRKKRDST